MLNYFILLDVIANLDNRVKNQIIHSNYLYSISSQIDMLNYYAIYRLFNVKHPLYHKILNEKQDKLMNYFKEVAKKNNEEELLLIYSFIVTKILNQNLTPYIESISNEGKSLKSQRKKQEILYFINLNIKEVFHNKIDPTDLKEEYISDVTALENVFKNVYHYSNTKAILLNSQKNYNNYYKTNKNIVFIKKIYYFFHDLISRNNIKITTSFKTTSKHNYLNLENKLWVNPHNNKQEYSSVLDIYSKTVDEAIMEINNLTKVNIIDKIYKDPSDYKAVEKKEKKLKDIFKFKRNKSKTDN